VIGVRRCFGDLNEARDGEYDDDGAKEENNGKTEFLLW
jgi:hypothetical protein